MTFKDAVSTCFGKYATFRGRASRSEMWWFHLFIYILILPLVGIGMFLAIRQTEASGVSLDQIAQDPKLLTASGGAAIFCLGLAVLVFLATFLPSLAVTIRRLHDRNMSGWWYLGFVLLGQIPIVGAVISLATLVIYCLKGTPGDNRFGPDPLTAQHSADVFT